MKCAICNNDGPSDNWMMACKCNTDDAKIHVNCVSFMTSQTPTCPTCGVGYSLWTWKRWMLYLSASLFASVPVIALAFWFGGAKFALHLGFLTVCMVVGIVLATRLYWNLVDALFIVLHNPLKAIQGFFACWIFLAMAFHQEPGMLNNDEETTLFIEFLFSYGCLLGGAVIVVIDEKYDLGMLKI